ncbi:MAG: SMC-Scp complex subunit ScpB [Acidaminococcaceae bacterium]
MFYDYLQSNVEALLFAAGEPLSSEKIAAILQIESETVQHLLDLLAENYAQAERGLCIRCVAGGYQLTTKPEMEASVRQLVAKQELKLTNAALETLAIVAFKQPVTRSEMEAIRGVQVDGVVNTLLDCGLIEEAGRKNTLGRPILYATSDTFLVTFGLNSLQDLPQLSAEQLFNADNLKTDTNNTEC